MLNFTLIRDIMERARKQYFTDRGNVTAEGIYYMNGNDGTDFDMEMNGRLCEFYIFKPNKDGKADDGLIKFLAGLNGKYTMYIYDYDDPYNGVYKLETGPLGLDVQLLGIKLQKYRDDKEIYDDLVTEWELK